MAVCGCCGGVTVCDVCGSDDHRSDECPEIEAVQKDLPDFNLSTRYAFYRQPGTLTCEAA